MQLAARRVARVGADPGPGPGGQCPAGDRRLSYLRLHGTPRLDDSAYDAAALEQVAQRLRFALAWSEEVWCIFDNTAEGAALGDALELLRRLGTAPQSEERSGPPDAEQRYQQHAGQRDQHRAGDVEQQPRAQHVRHPHPPGAEHHRVR